MLRHDGFSTAIPTRATRGNRRVAGLEEQRAAGKPTFRRGHFLHQGGAHGTACPVSATRCLKATFMTIFAAIGAAYTLDGNMAGPFLFIIPNVLLNVMFQVAVHQIRL